MRVLEKEQNGITWDSGCPSYKQKYRSSPLCVWCHSQSTSPTGTTSCLVKSSPIDSPKTQAQELFNGRNMHEIIQCHEVKSGQHPATEVTHVSFDEPPHFNVESTKRFSGLNSSSILFWTSSNFFTPHTWESHFTSATHQSLICNCIWNHPSHKPIMQMK